MTHQEKQDNFFCYSCYTKIEKLETNLIEKIKSDKSGTDFICFCSQDCKSEYDNIFDNYED